jgi:hypothetical protein
VAGKAVRLTGVPSCRVPGIRGSVTAGSAWSTLKGERTMRTLVGDVTAAQNMTGSGQGITLTRGLKEIEEKVRS